ncbi:unnamed protein product [Sphenostylis stenocarpa]|uniref:Uncharacterized protein n=1 Tax=Sphenostylis stenocarpa TaxID=92480 RepID=A0AA86T754_9FABA|nr:unnamed protein product [Sphenostylis stenocarpa]
MVVMQHERKLKRKRKSANWGRSNGLMNVKPGPIIERLFEFVRIRKSRHKQ